MDINTSIFNILGSVDHQLHPFTVKIKNKNCSPISISLNPKEISIAVIAGLAVAILFSPLSVFIALGMGYATFTFVAARIKIEHVKNLDPNLFCQQKIARKEEREAAEIAINLTVQKNIEEGYQSFQKQVELLYNISQPEEAKLYLKNFKEHYELTWNEIKILSALHKRASPSLAKKLELDKQQREIEGIQIIFSALFAHLERINNLEKIFYNTTETTFIDFGSQLRGAEERLYKLPYLIDFAMDQQLEALTKNWGDHLDKWPEKLTNLTLSTLNTKTWTVTKHLVERK